MAVSRQDGVDQLPPDGMDWRWRSGPRVVKKRVRTALISRLEIGSFANSDEGTHFLEKGDFRRLFAYDCQI